MADSNPQPSGESNPNKITPAGSIIKGDIPTSPEKVYRHVTGQEAIEDIHTSGVVRTPYAAGVRKTKSKRGDNVYWSQGVDGVNQMIDKNKGFVIEAPYNVASRRQVRADDITAVYQNRNGRVTNILEEEDENPAIVRRSRGFLGRGNSEVPPLKYRIGIVGCFALAGTALFFDVAELLISLFSGGFGSYVKDFASVFLFPFLFWAFGVPFWKGSKRIQKLITMVTAFLISLVPYLSDIMPELFVSVVVTLLYTRIEDRINYQLRVVKRKPGVTRSRRG